MAEIDITLDTSWINDVVVRNVEQNDLPALEWDGEFTHFRRVNNEAYRRSVQGLSVLWLADSSIHGVIGQVFVQLSCDRPELCNGIDRAYLYAFRVKHHFRSMGIGALILRTVEDDLLQRHYRCATLNVAQENYRALSFYRRHEFKIVAPEPGRWTYVDHEGHIREVNEPAWRMEKSLVTAQRAG